MKARTFTILVPRLDASLESDRIVRVMESTRPLLSSGRMSVDFDARSDLE